MLGEIIAWMVGWALILEYAVAAGAVAVGWSGYVNGFLHTASALRLPHCAALAGPWRHRHAGRRHQPPGGFNLLAFLIVAVRHLCCW